MGRFEPKAEVGSFSPDSVSRELSTKGSIVLPNLFRLCVFVFSFGPLISTASAHEAPSDAGGTVPTIWSQDSGTGVGFGYENGSWGGSWAQGVRVKVPVVPHFAVGLRGLMINTPRPGDDRWDFGGRLELLGQSRVLLSVMRLYGGGGVQLFHPISDEANEEVHVGGGGHFGFEFFMAPHLAFFIEIGGQSGVASDPAAGDIATGATIMAGLTVYPF